jgi:hypothetical protein
VEELPQRHFSVTDREEGDRSRVCGPPPSSAVPWHERLRPLHPSRFYASPRAHWRRIRSTNEPERLHGEIKRRICVVGAFPDRSSALRLITAVALHVSFDIETVFAGILVLTDLRCSSIMW